MRLLQSESAKKMHEAIPVYEREEASVIHEENIPKNRESNLMLESLQSKSTVLGQRDGSSELGEARPPGRAVPPGVGIERERRQTSSDDGAEQARKPAGDSESPQ